MALDAHGAYLVYALSVHGAGSGQSMCLFASEDLATRAAAKRLDELRAARAATPAEEAAALDLFDPIEEVGADINWTREPPPGMPVRWREALAGAEVAHVLVGRFDGAPGDLCFVVEPVPVQTATQQDTD